MIPSGPSLDIHARKEKNLDEEEYKVKPHAENTHGGILNM